MPLRQCFPLHAFDLPAELDVPRTVLGFFCISETSIISLFYFECLVFRFALKCYERPVMETEILFGFLFVGFVFLCAGLALFMFRFILGSFVARAQPNSFWHAW